MAKNYNLVPEDVKIKDFIIKGINIGETGRGRQLNIIPCVDDKTLQIGLSQTGKPKLINSVNKDGWVIRISTESSYIRGADGYVSVYKEHLNLVKVVAKGLGAYGAAGRIGNWEDYILEIMPKNHPVLLRVKPSRGNAKLWLITQDKVTEDISYEQADALDINYGDSSPTTKGDDFIRI